MTVTSGKDWRAPEEVELPSGKTPLLCKPDLISLLLAGDDVPDFLTDVMVRRLNGEEIRQEDLKFKSLEGLQGSTKLFDLLARACFVSPRIVDKPFDELADDEILIGHVAFEDKVFVFEWATGGLVGGQGNAAHKFLTEQAADLDALSAGGDVRAESGGDPGDN